MEERKEAAMTSNPCHQLSSKPSSITQDQLSKFRELQRRRLKMQAKSKIKKKNKGPSDSKGKQVSKDIVKEDENADQGLNDSSVNSSSKGNDKNETSSLSSQVDVHPALRKKKLHWGLDTKERWERKANM